MPMSFLKKSLLFLLIFGMMSIPICVKHSFRSPDAAGGMALTNSMFYYWAATIHTPYTSCLIDNPGWIWKYMLKANHPGVIAARL